MSSMSSIQKSGVSPISKVSIGPCSYHLKVTNLIRAIYHKFTPQTKNATDDKPIKWTKTYTKLLQLKEEFEQKEKLPGAKTYNLRMYDLVLGHDRPTLSPKESVSF